MTLLADVALAFCRECLGWRMPVDRRFAEQNRNATGDGGSKAWSPYIFDGDAKHDQFHYTDLDAVMGAAQGWCEANRLDCTLRYVCISELFEARLVGDGLNGNMSRELAQSLRTKPCDALLSACVEAARKLKVA